MIASFDFQPGGDSRPITKAQVVDLLRRCPAAYIDPALGTVATIELVEADGIFFTITYFSEDGRKSVEACEEADSRTMTVVDSRYLVARSADSPGGLIVMELLAPIALAPTDT
jgi:hypothetical protein